MESMEIILLMLYLVAFIGPRFIMPALGLHAVLIGQSALRYGRIPLMGPRETLGFLSFAIGVTYRIARWKRERDLFTWLAGSLILCFLLGSFISPKGMRGPLPPVLNTIWFELHVVLS